MLCWTDYDPQIGIKMSRVLEVQSTNDRHQFLLLSTGKLGLDSFHVGKKAPARDGHSLSLSNPERGVSEVTCSTA